MCCKKTYKDGWTLIQEADAENHKLEISCFAKDNVVTEIRIRHNDGEEQVLNGKLDDKYSLPMPGAAFKKALPDIEKAIKEM